MTQAKDMRVRQICVLILLIRVTSRHTTFCGEAEFCDDVVDVVYAHSHSFLLSALQTLNWLLL